MATKKKSTDIAVSEQNQALINAIATGDTSGVDLEAVKVLVDSLGLSVVAKGVSTIKTSRKEEVASYVTAKELSEEDVETIARFADAMASAPKLLDPEDVRDLTPQERDALVEFEVVRRKVENIVKGSYESNRATAFNLLSFLEGDPHADGEILSVKAGHKIVVGHSTRKGEPDYDKLKEVLDEDVWNAITVEVTTREVDPELLTEALGDGRISLEQFAALVPEEKVIRNFTTKPIKEGDKV